MSLFAVAPMPSDWPSFRLAQRPIDEPDDIGLNLEYGHIQSSTIETGTPLRSHKTYPYTNNTSNYATPHYGNPLSRVANPGTEDEIAATSSEETRSTTTAPELSIQTTFGGSNPTSPITQPTPTSVELDHEDPMIEEDEDDEDDDYSILPDDGEKTIGADDASQNTAEKTAAEKRAEKRKMKRFRLTHNQTRFLMSEFARQAHPDAAQRERLSREIPGLSPRQVQVWFQNRRAKLKRLTTDDRERMMKSRALPDDFDMSRALHSPFVTPTSHSLPAQTFSTPMASPGVHASSYDITIARPLMINGNRREPGDENMMSPVSISSGYAPFFTPPGTVPTSENMSPISPSDDRTPFMSSSYSNQGARSSNPFSARSHSISSYTPSRPSIPRLQLHDRINRTRAESLASPLRTSISYTSNPDHARHSNEGHMQTPQPDGLGQPPRSFPAGESSASQSSGFTFGQGFQSSALARPRPTITNFPPVLDLRPSYRPLVPFSSLNNQTQNQSQEQSSLSNTTHITRQPTSSGPPSFGYSSAPLVPPNEFSVSVSSDMFYPYNEVQEGMLPSLGPGHGANSLELESYYKSEPERRHFSVASRHGNPSRLLSPSMSANNQTIGTSQAAGVKRRRESGSDEGESDTFGLDFGSGGRKRSFTLPSGYGA